MRFSPPIGSAAALAARGPSASATSRTVHTCRSLTVPPQTVETDASRERAERGCEDSTQDPRVGQAAEACLEAAHHEQEPDQHQEAEDRAVEGAGGQPVLQALADGEAG